MSSARTLLRSPTLTDRPQTAETADRHPYLRSLTPNFPAALLVLLAPLAELGLFCLDSHRVLQTSRMTAAHVFLFLLLLWFHLGWLGYGLIRVWGGLCRRAPWPLRALLKLAGPLLAVLFVSAYVACWLTYFQIGRFPNVEAFRFAVMNSTHRVLSLYLLHSERSGVLALGLTAGLLILAWPALAAGAARLARVAPPPTPRRRVAPFAASVLLIAVNGALGGRELASSEMRRGRWTQAVREQMHPAMSLMFSVFSFTVSERIPPVLSPEELTPLTQRPPPLPAATAPAPNIVLVAVESLRADVVHLRHQDREVTPALNELARHGVQFTNAHAQSTHSDYSDVCIPSSLYPLRTPHHHYYSAADPWPKTLVYDVVKPAGYATAYFSSQNEEWGGMDQFLLTPALDVFYDASRSSEQTTFGKQDVGLAAAIRAGDLRTGKLDDRHVMNEAVGWLRSQASRRQPFLLSVCLQASHFPYVLAEDDARPFQPAEINFRASFLRYPADKTPIVRNAYFNALYKCDVLLAQLVDALRDGGVFENTVLIVYGENGEAFHENNAVCHAGAAFQSQLRVALVYCAPGRLEPAVCGYPTELIDVVPTLFGLLGWPAQPCFQGVDVLAADRPPVHQRLLFFHTETGIAQTDAILYAGRWKLIHDRERGVSSLYDLAADPGETRDLWSRESAIGRRMRDTLTRWRQGQLAYYRYPQYYLNYYPPRPPAWNVTGTRVEKDVSLPVPAAD